jgi:hypothetical protein
MANELFRIKVDEEGKVRLFIVAEAFDSVHKLFDQAGRKYNLKPDPKEPEEPSPGEPDYRELELREGDEGEYMLACDALCWCQ